MTWLVALDVLLLTGLTLRLTRLVVTDDIGLWFIRTPLMRWAVNRELPHDGGEWVPGWRSNMVTGTSCPFCVGWHLDWIVLLSYGIATGWDVGSPGTLAEVWRWLAAPFALNYLTAHLGSRLGDTSPD